MYTCIDLFFSAFLPDKKGSVTCASLQLFNLSLFLQFFDKESPSCQIMLNNCLYKIYYKPTSSHVIVKSLLLLWYCQTLLWKCTSHGHFIVSTHHYWMKCFLQENTNLLHSVLKWTHVNALPQNIPCFLKYSAHKRKRHTVFCYHEHLFFQIDLSDNLSII